LLSVDAMWIGSPDGYLLSVFREISPVQPLSEALAAIADVPRDAMFGEDLNGIVTSWNAGAEEIFGYRADEIVGTSVTRLIPDDRTHEKDLILDKLRRGEHVDDMETVRRTKQGRLIDVSIAVVPIRDVRGRIAGASKIVREIAAPVKRTRDAERMSRLYASLSQINQAIVLTSNREGLFVQICEALVNRVGSIRRPRDCFRWPWLAMTRAMFDRSKSTATTVRRDAVRPERRFASTSLTSFKIFPPIRTCGRGWRRRGVAAFDRQPRFRSGWRARSAGC
jgi:PAS domain S-box-containing protein